MGTLLGRFLVVLGTLGAKKSQKPVPGEALGGEEVDVEKYIKKGERGEIRDIRHLGGMPLNNPTNPVPRTR